MSNNNSDYNNKMDKLAGHITNIVLLGFLTTLFCLPIVTAGAAFTALNISTKSYIYDYNDKPLKLYFESFKKYFGTSTKIWLIHLLAIAILVWDFVYYRTSDTTIDILASAGIFVVMCFVAFELTMVFVTIGEYNKTNIFEIMKTALDISMTSFFRSLMILFFEATIIVVSLFLLRGLLLVIPGIIAFVSWQIIPDMLKNYKHKNVVK